MYPRHNQFRIMRGKAAAHHPTIISTVAVGAPFLFISWRRNESSTYWYFYRPHTYIPTATQRGRRLVATGHASRELSQKFKFNHLVFSIFVLIQKFVQPINVQSRIQQVREKNNTKWLRFCDVSRRACQGQSRVIEEKPCSTHFKRTVQ